jgi:hypothetical protein
MKTSVLKLAFAFALACAALLGALSVPSAEANHHCGGVTACPAIYAPVICNNGVIYSNKCYADADCATGCRRYENEI